MSQHFQYVSVLTSPEDRKLIHWKMNRNFYTGTGSVKFYVDWARSGGPWTCLNPNEPVVNNCLYSDGTKRVFNMEKNIFYRARAVLADNTEYTSLPSQAIGTFDKESYLAAKEIARMNYLALKRRGGIQGFLLKRKEWGIVCPKCTDFDIEEVIKGSCDQCYGTGFIGGYYPGMEYWINPQPIGRDRKVDPNGLGETNQQTKICYGVAYPWIDSGDIWVDAHSNERWIIRPIKHKAEMCGHPLLVDLTMQRLPEMGIAMKIPINAVGERFENEFQECPSKTAELTDQFPTTNLEIVKSKESTDTGGWRRGLGEENW
jgi:hypothetical protein